MILTPKASFQQSKENMGTHARTVEALINTRAAEAALLEYQSADMFAKDGSEAAANYYRLEGARRVINVLLSLHEPPRKVTQRPSDNLNPT